LRKGEKDTLNWKFDSTLINNLSNGWATGVSCSIESNVPYHCGLNSLGEKALSRIEEVPDQLGVEMTEVPIVFLNKIQVQKGCKTNSLEGETRFYLRNIK